MSETKVDSSKLRLRFERPRTTDSPSLESQLLQIHQQRGRFRNITEQQLQQEIDHPETTLIDEAADDHVSDGENETVEDRQERIWKAREDMLQKLNYAQNEILSALDMMSFMLSKHVPAAGSSMSPVLQQSVPKGTLDSKVTQGSSAPSKETRRRLFQVSDGWKLDSFQAGSKKLADTAERLRQESDKQSKYWEQVADLKAHGWPVSRLPSNSRAIGVHFGFQEAAPQFRKQGFLLLKQNTNGDLELDTKLGPRQRKRFSVSILRNGHKVSHSPRRLATDLDRTSIHERVTAARDALFEEELFYELNREARYLANQGVRTRPGTVEADISPECRLQISHSEAQDSPGNDITGETVAQFVMVTAKLLLSAEHKRNYARRTQRPSPMTLNAPAAAEYAILRPLLAQLRHAAVMDTTMERLSMSLSPVKHCLPKLHTHLATRAPSSEGIIPHDIESLGKVVRSEIELQLGDDFTLLSKVETHLGAPWYGTNFSTNKVDHKHVKVPAMSMSSLAELVEHVSHVFMLRISSSVADVAEQVKCQLNWFQPKPQSGHFVLVRDHNIVSNATIEIRDCMVVMMVSPLGGSQASTAKNMAFVWKPNGLHQKLLPQSQKVLAMGLADVLGEIDSRLST